MQLYAACLLQVCPYKWKREENNVDNRINWILTSYLGTLITWISKKKTFYEHVETFMTWDEFSAFEDIQSTIWNWHHLMWLQFDKTDCRQVSCPKAPTSSWIFSWVMAEMSMTWGRVLSIKESLPTSLKCEEKYCSIVHYSIDCNLQLFKVTVTKNTFGQQIGNVSISSYLVDPC